MQCPLCFQEIHSAIPDTCYLQCTFCEGIVRDHVHWLSPNDEHARYNLHQYNPQHDGYYRFVQPLTSFALKHFAPSSEGLDFGCGPGHVLASYLIQHGLSVSYYDPIYYPNGSALQRQYDFVYACEVVEHFHCPAFEFSRLRSMLKPLGSLLIMTHVYEPGSCGPFSKWYYKNDPTHVFIYTQKTLDFIAYHWELIHYYASDRFQIFIKP